MRDYIAMINAAQTPEEAATLVRAHACHAIVIAGIEGEPGMSLIRQAERVAQMLERPYDAETGKPWRKWLKESGY